MRVLITGVAGFLGSHLADKFLERGDEVVGIDNLIGGYPENVPSGVEFHQLDLLDLDKLDKPFEGVELVVHAACTAYEGLSVFSPSLIVANTTQITTNALTASIRAGVKKFIYMSSMARYGDHDGIQFQEDFETRPQDPYGIAKVASEMLVRNLSEVHGMDWVILVPHNIVGPRQKFDDPYRNVASIFTNRMLLGLNPIIYGDGSQQRCFSFIQDVMNPLMVAVDSPEAVGQVINLGPDESTITILELAERIADILDFDLNPIYMKGRPQEVKIAHCSSDKARRLLGYETTVDIDKGLRELVGWIQSKGAREFNYHLPIEIVNELTPLTWTRKLM